MALSGLTAHVLVLWLIRLSVVAAFANPPLIILPGFGNDVIDYQNPLSLGESESFEFALQKRGFSRVHVVPVKRSDWLKFASGVVTTDFWQMKMTPSNPSFKWYLDKVVATVEEAVEQAGGEKAVLIGHSAGGWLARAALADGTWSGSLTNDASELVRGCITLGSPHAPPLTPDTPDMTRGALTHVHRNYPGAFLKNRGVFYTTVAGSAVRGNPEAERGTVEKFAYGSYRQVCGRGDVTGDGVVPLDSAHLEGARQVTLEGVYHSINARKVWYGADEVLDSWLEKVPELR